MVDLNEGTRLRNLRRVGGSGDPLYSGTGNLRTVSSGGPPAPSTDWIQALGGRIGGWCIENGRLTADGGNVRLNSYVPSISLGSATDFDTGTGIWEGRHGGVYKWRVGNPAANYVSWDNATLTVVGTITAEAGTIGGWAIGANAITADSGNVSINSGASPSIKMGLATDYFTGAGFFVGKSGGAYKWHIGDPDGEYVKWDGANLTVKGTVTTGSLNPALQSFTANTSFASIDDDTVTWDISTIKLASGVTYVIVGGNTGNMTALTYIYLDTAVSTTVLQTTTTYSNAVGDGRILLAAAQNHAGGASVIPYTGQQPIINATAQITALSIVAGNIAANAVTADKISVTTLAAIQANIGAATISDVLTIGATGGIYQGTGTFASPTTGLKVWNDSGVGRLATYLSGALQVYFDTSGKLNAGAGAVTLDANGVVITTPSATQANNGYKFSGTDYTLFGTYAHEDAGESSLELRCELTKNLPSTVYITSQAQTNYLGKIELLATSGGPLTCISWIKLTADADASPASEILLSTDRCKVTGGLSVGTVATVGAGDITASGNATITGTLSVGGSNIIAHTTGEGSLGSDVAMAVADTYYDGPSVSLGAGTWFVTGHVTVTDTAVNLFTAKLWDGTTVESSGEMRVADGNPGWGVIALEGIVTLAGTTTVKISVAALNASGSIKAAAGHNGAGNNASHIQAVKII